MSHAVKLPDWMERTMAFYSGVCSRGYVSFFISFVFATTIEMKSVVDYLILQLSVSQAFVFMHLAK